MKNKTTHLSLLLLAVLCTFLSCAQPSNVWVQKADFPVSSGRAQHVGFSIGNKGYIGMGSSTGSGYNLYNDIWEFDPVTNVWTQKANFPGGGRYMAGCLAINGKAYIGNGNDLSTGYNDLYEFDPNTNTWQAKASTNNMYGGYGFFTVGNKGYCIQMWGSASQVYEYDPSLDTWTQKGNFPGPKKSGPPAFTIGNYAYVTCGGAGLIDTWRYDPNTDTWAQKANFPSSARSLATGFSIGNKGYVSCGSLGGNTFAHDLWEYDPALDTWAQKANFGGAVRYDSRAFCIGTKGYLGTGQNLNGTYELIDFWEYTPTCSFTTPTVSVSNVSCNGNSTGSVTLSVTGGTGALSYSWSPAGGSSFIAANMPAGTYTCYVSDANACAITKTVTITQPPAIVSSVASQTAVTCYGTNTGGVTLSASGGTGTLTYSWAPSGGAGPVAAGLAAGTYTCIITDANSCVKTQTVSISQPAAITSSVSSQTNVSGCFGNTNGSATILAGGGTGAYTYNWLPAGGTSATATSLAAGTYTCTITDANSCVKTQTVSISQPTAVTSTVSSKTDVSGCFGNSNGAATVSASGGTGAYTYSWAPLGGTAATATSLTAGNYTCTITDANSCVKTQTISISQPVAISATVSAQGNVSCNGGNDGSATVSASGGTGAYTYSWSPAGGNAAVASGLSANNYTCTIKDINNCIYTQTINITQPTAISSFVSALTNVSCNGGNNGSVTISAGGGTGTLSYSWSPNTSVTSSASSLAAAVYTCTITDMNSCVRTQTVSITQPTAINTSVFTQNNVSGCYGYNNGSATILASGGTGTLNYLWLPSGGNSSSASNLFANSYTCYVTDANNCTVPQLVTITQPLAITPSVTSQSDVTCNGGNNGSAAISASGGTGALSYLWAPNGSTLTSISNLVAGTYTCTVTDINNCTKTQTVTILQPAAITASITSQNNVSCSGGTNGSATVLAGGGTGTLSYNWQPAGGISATASNLSIGNYTCVITDANNCTHGQPVTIVQAATAVPNICMLTADSLSLNNIIYWDPTLYPTADSFLIYRYDAFSTNYLQIGTVPGDTGHFTDTQRNIGGPNGGDPQYSSWLYKLAIKDSCGNIGAKSPYHQSIFIQESAQNFSWNAYGIETGQSNPVTGYSFSRDDNNTGSWHVLVNTGGLSSTDPNYTSYPNGNWRVDALGFSCQANARYTSNGMQGNVVKSKSNITNNRTMGIKRTETTWTLYPNPSTESIMLDLQGLGADKINVKIISMLGEEIYNEVISNQEKMIIDLSAYGKGTYLVQVIAGEKTFTKRLVKQ